MIKKDNLLKKSLLNLANKPFLALENKHLL